MTISIKELKYLMEEHTEKAINYNWKIANSLEIIAKVLINMEERTQGEERSVRG